MRVTSLMLTQDMLQAGHSPVMRISAETETSSEVSTFMAGQRNSQCTLALIRKPLLRLRLHLFAPTTGLRDWLVEPFCRLPRLVCEMACLVNRREKNC